MYRYSWPGAAAVVRAFLAAEAASRVVTPAGTRASHLASARGDADSLTALLAAGSPPGAVDADKQTIVHLVGLHKMNAALDPKLEMKAYGFNHPCACNVISWYHCVCLQRVHLYRYNLAARSGCGAATAVAALACASLRTRSGGLEAWDRWKRTAAAWALHGGHVDALEALRKAGSRMVGRCRLTPVDP